MTSRCLVIITIITLCFGLSNFVVNGRDITPSDVVKTIQTEDGVYYCVDFYKQPAFDHPSLKNHSFYPEMKPSFQPIEENTNEIPDEGLIDIELKGDTCPNGTVPIRNITEEDQLISQSRRQRYAQLGEQHANKWSASNIFFAIGQSKSNIRKMYNGLASNITIWNPNTHDYQYSSSEIILKSGNDAIIVGWTVNTMVYKDDQTRFFIYTVSGNSHCMNSRCGFIQVDKSIPLDFPIKPYSIYRGQKKVYRFFVYKDPRTGNWWLQIGFKKRVVGFWPKSFFNSLSGSGTYIACGGEVYSANTGGIQMGSGEKSDSHESFCRNVQYIDQDFKGWTATHLEPYSDSPKDFTVDIQVDGLGDHLVYFGGTRNIENPPI